MLCHTLIFKINGIEADESDFGEQFDRDSENNMTYGCGDMKFTRIPSTPEILSKYDISEEDYKIVCDKLEDGLSFGSCGRCM